MIDHPAQQRSVQAQFKLIFLIAFASLVTASPRVGAQPYIYGMNDDGNLGVNGTPLENLGDDGWVDMVVLGGDRYALHLDGEVRKNGLKLFDNPSGCCYPDLWIDMDVTPGGTVYSLRQDGLLYADDGKAANLPYDGFPNVFRRVIVQGNDVYCLRSDGAVFKNGSSSRIVRFNGRDGVFGFDDGEELDTVWNDMQFHPMFPNTLFALRTDGLLYFTNLIFSEDNETEVEAELPFPDDTYDLGNLYPDLAFLDSGDWLVLRGEGRVYSEDSPLDPIAEFPGDASSEDEIYTSLAPNGDNFFVIRADGRVYSNLDEENELFTFDGDTYLRVAVSSEPPDLSNIKNLTPVVVTYNTKTVVGTPLSVPVLATDTEKAPEDLIVTIIEPLPPGAVWNEGERLLEWATPGPAGSYSASFEVNDGVNKPVKVTHKLKIVDPDDDPEKNRKPLVSKIKNVQAIIDQQLSVPLFVDDEDGDDLVVDFDSTAYPFSSGAIFNPATRTFIWTPGGLDLGKVTVVFIVSDGIATKEIKIKIEIVYGFIFL